LRRDVIMQNPRVPHFSRILREVGRAAHSSSTLA
jgi:hypothetical protein